MSEIWEDVKSVWPFPSVVIRNFQRNSGINRDPREKHILVVYKLWEAVKVRAYNLLGNYLTFILAWYGVKLYTARRFGQSGSFQSSPSIQCHHFDDVTMEQPLKYKPAVFFLRVL